MLRKQSGGLFLAPPQQLRCEDPQEQRDMELIHKKNNTSKTEVLL
ncbi:hypothetical protein [uncultured Eubacterium sp.]|nr:hypothetical protein [uncultured Eubacterium sp.]